MKEQGENASEQTSESMEATEQPATSSVAPRIDLLVDEHEEEVSENGRTVRHRGIYLHGVGRAGRAYRASDQYFQ